MAVVAGIALAAAAGSAAASGSQAADQGALSKALSKRNFEEQLYLRRLNEQYNNEMFGRSDMPTNTPYGSVGYNPNTQSYETRLSPLEAAISAASQGNLLHQNTIDSQAIQGQQARDRLVQLILANQALTQARHMQYADANTLSNSDASALLALDKLSSGNAAIDSIGAGSGTQYMRNGVAGANLTSALQNAGRSSLATATGGNAVPGMQLASQTNAQRVGNFANLADALYGRSSQSIGTPSTADPYGTSLSQLAAQKQGMLPQMYAVAKQNLGPSDAPQQQPYTANPGMAALASGLGSLSTALAQYGGDGGSTSTTTKKPQGIDTPYK